MKDKNEKKDIAVGIPDEIKNKKIKEVSYKINKLILEFEKEFNEKVVAIGSVQRLGQHKNDERVELIMVY